jgi:small-conductance mechanosensitive channel
METLNKFLDLELLHFDKHQIKVYNLALVILIFILAWLLIWLIRKAMFRKTSLDRQAIGNKYALFQIIKYGVIVTAIIFGLDAVGIKITVLLAGSAALLVGVGLGLQQTFNDFISGIIILSERSIRIGDVLEIDGDIILIQEIGWRTSRGLNRDEISLIIPNSLMTKNTVINWSHQSKTIRFRIDIGVAYGSDIDLVARLLRESALEHPASRNPDSIDVRLIDFGNSSIDFQLLFFSENVFRIEKVKSEIRMIIHRKFKENGVTIPFPQVDVHMKPN